ncbi:hypothetical protein ACKWTF_002175 [Chironomus riparius]
MISFLFTLDYDLMNKFTRIFFQIPKYWPVFLRISNNNNQSSRQVVKKINKFQKLLLSFLCLHIIYKKILNNNGKLFRSSSTIFSFHHKINVKKKTKDEGKVLPKYPKRWEKVISMFLLLLLLS